MPDRPVPRPLVAVLTCVALAALGAPARAPAADGGASGQAGPEVEPDPPAEHDTWLDLGHSFLEERVFAPVVAFDRFFSDEKELDAERSRSFLQWRNELRFDVIGRPQYATTVRANLRMPGLDQWLKRVRLVIEGQTREAVSALFPETPDASGGPSGTANAGLRFGLWEGLVSRGELDAGVLLQMPPGVFGRLRLRGAFPVGRLFLTRVSTSGFWRTDTHLGTAVGLQLERALGPAALLRLANDAQVTQRSVGVEWSSELAALFALDPHTAAAISAGLRGATAAPDPIDRYRVATRLRRAFWRSWLFVELEPEVYWPWAIAGPRPTKYAVTARLEVQFHGTERTSGATPARTDAPGQRADPPEPKDPPEPAGPSSGG